MLRLLLFALISPLRSELLDFVSSVHIIEGSELGTSEIGEVPSLDVSKIEGNQIFVMPDHSSNPLVVGPSSHS